MMTPNTANISSESVRDSTVMIKRFFCLRALREASLPVQPKSRPEMLNLRIFLTALGLALIASTGDFLMTRMPVP